MESSIKICFQLGDPSCNNQGTAINNTLIKPTANNPMIEYINSFSLMGGSGLLII